MTCFQRVSTIMQLNKTAKFAVTLNSRIRKKFENKVCNFLISDVCDDIKNQSFAIHFTAYNYFNLKIIFEHENVCCYILQGNYAVKLELSHILWNISEFDLFLDELQEELELRIPDKYLIKHGWT